MSGPLRDAADRAKSASTARPDPARRRARPVVGHEILAAVGLEPGHGDGVQPRGQLPGAALLAVAVDPAVVDQLLAVHRQRRPARQETGQVPAAEAEKANDARNEISLRQKVWEQSRSEVDREAGRDPSSELVQKV